MRTQHDETVERLRAEARRRRLRLTPQRDVLLRVLAGFTHHPTADELYRRVRTHMPSVSPATVYRNVQTLVGAGVISKLERAGGPVRYDANLDEHHHFICERCRRVFDVYLRDVSWRAQPRTSGIAGARVSSCQIHLHGVCASCRSGRRA